jgi:hypothetical protein
VHGSVTSRARWGRGARERLAHSGVLDCMMASIWLGRGGVHGETRAVSAQRIDPGGQHGVGGEVIGLGMVGGALPTLGAPGGHGDIQGGVGC